MLLIWRWAGSKIEEMKTLAEIYAYQGNITKLFETAKSDDRLLVKYEAKLASKHPNLYLKRYNDMIEKLIVRRGRESYREASKYGASIKKIYQKVLEKPQEWSWYISNLRNKNKILRALQEELDKKGL